MPCGFSGSLQACLCMRNGQAMPAHILYGGTPGWPDSAVPAGAVLDDVALVWANCRQYNEPTSELLPLCTAAEASFWQRWQDAGLPTGVYTFSMHKICRAQSSHLVMYWASSDCR